MPLLESQNGQSTVSILDKGKVKRVTVETGLTSDSQTEVTSGLKEGDMVITNTITTYDNSQNFNSRFLIRPGVQSNDARRPLKKQTVERYSPFQNL